MFYHVTLQELSGLLAQNISDATLFGSPQWLSMWSAIGATPLIFQAPPEDKLNKGVSFSALRIGSSPVSRIQAQIDGLPGMVTYPDSICSEPICSAVGKSQVSDAVRDSIFLALREASGLYAHWVDYFNQFSSNNLPAGWAIHQLETQRIPLGDDSSCGGSRAFADSVTRHIKSGKKSGALVRPASSPADALATYKLAKATHDRHNRNRTYPLELYEKLLGLAQNDDRVMWFMCENEGAVIGAHIALHEADAVLSWAPYMDREGSALKPAYVLMDKVISVACERGAAYVDLGVTPAGSSGVQQFKSRFGGAAYKYNVFVSRSLLARVLGKGGLS